MRSSLLNASLTPSGRRKKGLMAFLAMLFLCMQSVATFAQGTSSISCPADIVQNSDAGACTARVTFPLTNDVVTNANYFVVYSINSGAAFSIGTTRVTKQLLDQNGVPLSTCTFNVTVLDKEGPVINNCPGNLAVGTTANTCGAVVSFASPIALERCTLQRKTFYYTGSQQTFVVPAGVTTINVDMTGGEGGHTFFNNSVYGFPGFGGEVSGTLHVTPGQVLYLNVGGAGQDGRLDTAGAGGYNGGGNGSAVADDKNIILFAGGGGGGASDIRINGTALADRILVAGGGGAAGINQNAGHGGDLAGGNAEAGNASSTAASTPATGGTQSSGGAGGYYHYQDTFFFAGSGDLGVGGSATYDLTGGGGGGGYFGGGAGSFGAGAGGSSYAAAGVTGVYHVQAAQEGNGLVTISYNQPPTIELTQGLPSGSVYPVGETINSYTATDAAGNTSTCTFKVIVTDDEKPTLNAPAAQSFSTIAASYAIPPVSAADNCGIASIAYSISGATTRSGNGSNATGSFNAGSSVITYTVTDIHGNTQTATTTVNIAAASIAVSVADVWAVSPWGNPNTIYLGFGPTSLTLKAVPTGATTPLTYAWKKDGNTTVMGTAASLVVSSAGIYTATVTGQDGAVGTVTKEIKMEDLRCGDKDDKVAICHTSTGSNDNTRTICVSKSSVDKFLGNGNYLGNCTQARIAMVTEPEAIVVAAPGKFNVYPNPASRQFTVQLNNFKTGKAQVIILSPNGMAVQKKTIELIQVNQSILFNLGNLTTGIYTVRIISDEGIQTSKVVLQ
jgi:hypothetical protein